MSLAMSKEQREAFLAATRVGIVSIAEDGRGPLTVPVWYHYAPGGVVRFTTARTSRKATLLARVSRASLCVQTETAPYSYVSVEGPATVGPTDFEAEVREMALRYLGTELGEAYLAQVHPDRSTDEVVTVTLAPQRWWSVDYRKM